MSADLEILPFEIAEGSILEMVVDKNVEQYQKLLAECDDMMRQAMLSSAVPPTMTNGSFSSASSFQDVTVEKLRQHREFICSEMKRYMTNVMPSSLKVTVPLESRMLPWNKEPRPLRRRGTHW